MAAAAGLEPASFPVNGRASSPGRLSRNVAGTAGRSRTCGLCARNAALCPLSYGGMASVGRGDRIRTCNGAFARPIKGRVPSANLDYAPAQRRLGLGGWIRTNDLLVPSQER
jgi:hypothetical protein